MSSTRPLIWVGVPVWHGAELVGATIESVLRQRDVHIAVLISVDGADALSADACRPFLADPRVRLVVQPERLGWVHNSAVAVEPAAGAGAGYCCVQPHDDLMKDGYLASLLHVAERLPTAAVVYSDIEVIGIPERKIIQESVTGSSLARQMELLARHFNAVAWRGLTRLSALSSTARLGRRTFGDFAADTVWMARLARAGELIRVPEPLYLKSFHGRGAHEEWRAWPREQKKQAWIEHCLAMLDEALPVARRAEERQDLVDAARQRLLQNVQPLGSFRHDFAKMVPEERAQMLASFNSALELRIPSFQS